METPCAFLWLDVQAFLSGIWKTALDESLFLEYTREAAWATRRIFLEGRLPYRTLIVVLLSLNDSTVG